MFQDVFVLGATGKVGRTAVSHMFNTAVRSPLVKLPRIQAHLDSVLSGYSATSLGIDLREYK